MNKVLTPLTSALILTIMLIGLLPAPVAAQEAVGDFAQVDAYVEELRATSNVPGMALAIVRDGEIVYERGYIFPYPKGPSTYTKVGCSVFHIF
jgi:CubicO group peptidase (beta-lactamase class C family)